MWNMPFLVSDFLNQFDNVGNRSFRSTFEKVYTCYPVSFKGREDLEKGNKVLLPQSALTVLSQMDLSWPIIFRVVNPENQLFSHCGVLEFSAEENMCYMPYWMMQNLCLNEGNAIKLVNTQLPRGTFVKLQPVTSDFLDITDHRSVLESNLRHFATLTEGDVITIKHENKRYSIDIIECKPQSAILIVETDIEVDFSPPKDYVEPEPIVKYSKTTESFKSTGSIGASSVNELDGLNSSTSTLESAHESKYNRTDTVSNFIDINTGYLSTYKVLPGGVRTVRPNLIKEKNSSKNEEQTQPFKGIGRSLI